MFLVETDTKNIQINEDYYISGFNTEIQLKEKPDSIIAERSRASVYSDSTKPWSGSWVRILPGDVFIFQELDGELSITRI